MMPFGFLVPECFNSESHLNGITIPRFPCPDAIYKRVLFRIREHSSSVTAVRAEIFNWIFSGGSLNTLLVSRRYTGLRTSPPAAMLFNSPPLPVPGLQHPLLYFLAIKKYEVLYLHNSVRACTHMDK